MSFSVGYRAPTHGHVDHDARLAEQLDERGLDWPAAAVAQLYPRANSTLLLHVAFASQMMILAEDTLGGAKVGDRDTMYRAIELLTRMIARDRTTLLGGTFKEMRRGLAVLRMHWHALACTNVALAGRVRPASGRPTDWPETMRRGMIVSPQDVSRMPMSIMLMAQQKIMKRWNRSSPDPEVFRYCGLLCARTYEMLVLPKRMQAAYDDPSLYNRVGGDEHGLKIPTEHVWHETERFFFYVGATQSFLVWLGKAGNLPRWETMSAARGGVFRMINDELLPSGRFMSMIGEEFLKHSVDAHCLPGEMERLHITNELLDDETPDTAIRKFRPREYTGLQQQLSAQNMREDILEPYMRDHLHDPPQHGILEDQELNFTSMAMLVMHFVMQFESNGLSIFDSVFLDTAHFVPSDDLTKEEYRPVDHTNAAVRERKMPCVVQVQSSYFLIEFGDQPGSEWLRPGDRVTHCLDIVDAFAAWIKAVCEHPVVRGNVGDRSAPKDVRSLYKRVWGKEAPHIWDNEKIMQDKRRRREERSKSTVPNGIRL